MTATLSLPRDPADFEVATDEILQHLASQPGAERDEHGDARVDADQAERLIGRWCEQVGADDDTLAAALAYAFAPPEPEPESQSERESKVEPQSDAQPQPEPPAGDLGARLAALEEQVQDAPEAEWELPAKWAPREQPTLTGVVCGTEWVASAGVRVLVLRDAHGREHAAWLGPLRLQTAIRTIERQWARELRPGDLVAIAFKGERPTGRNKLLLFAAIAEQGPVA